MPTKHKSPSATEASQSPWQLRVTENCRQSNYLKLPQQSRPGKLSYAQSRISDEALRDTGSTVIRESAAKGVRPTGTVYEEKLIPERSTHPISDRQKLCKGKQQATQEHQPRDKRAKSTRRRRLYITQATPEKVAEDMHTAVTVCESFSDDLILLRLEIWNNLKANLSTKQIGFNLRMYWNVLIDNMAILT